MQFNYSIQWAFGKEGKEIDLILFRCIEQNSSVCFCCCRGDVPKALQKFQELLKLVESNARSIFAEVSFGGHITANCQDESVLFHMEKETDDAISVFSLRIPFSVCAPVFRNLCKELSDILSKQ
ncbi:hypothetical protein LAU_0035 [Lausannevirus]|uniref:Uncharacterized protein n=1 Tax=Lausannevirus TaxID=999883 RepID=F2WKW8_9VIRU|nr:hypothetical protein LAU_0035 [Lausannevirus]AEA06891.1 hypothetical protein LAU_0035 [Lausannevirus]